MGDSLLLEGILKRLNILVSLQLDKASGTEDMSSRIRKLKDLGLSPSEIGEIVGKKANYVSAVLGSKRATKR